ncbi:MAG TPA: hypothetical protein VFX18_04895 [Candidatus Nitrosocosmicus sp.]|nr:hypothetical protein [Candidatus Nitrosocosmicus sp.]
MKRKHFIELSSNCLLCKVAKESGFVIFVPNSWAYKEVFIFYPDSYIERNKVLLSSANRGYIPIAHFYGDPSNYKNFNINGYGNKDLLVRLIQTPLIPNLNI